MKTLQDIFRYTKASLRMDIRRNLAYPVNFWFVFFTIPFFSAVQIAFVESIYGQTSSFVGYTKYQAYLLFGTFRLVQGLVYFLFYSRLAILKDLIRGEGEETFDSVLLKPIDSQLYATTGKYILGNISPILVGVLIIAYAVAKGHMDMYLLNVIVYLILVFSAVFLMYIVFLLISTLHFWFNISESAEGIWDSMQSFGQYPPNLYHGALGILFNIVLPLTLMAGIPVNVLLGKVPLTILLLYLAILLVFFYVSRVFWKFAVKQYSSSSS